MRIIITILLNFIPILLLAQKNEFVFSKPSNEEIQYKIYEKDKSAAAVVLYDYTKVSFEYEVSQPKYIIEKQVRIKILNNSGVENGNISIPFISTSNFEDVDKIKGVTINVGEGGKWKQRKLPKQIFINQKRKNHFPL